MVEVNPALTDRVVTALHKFVALANTMLKNGEGVEEWTATRWEDFVMTLQWYDFLGSHHIVSRLMRSGNLKGCMISIQTETRPSWWILWRDLNGVASRGRRCSQLR